MFTVCLHADGVLTCHNSIDCMTCSYCCSVRPWPSAVNNCWLHSDAEPYNIVCVLC